MNPSLIPPVTFPFAGELRCFQVDQSNAPIGGNALTGSATLLGPGSEVAQYDAVPLRGLNVDSDLTLNLDGVEYEACPETLHTAHRADRHSIPGVPSVGTRNILTVIPCTVDYDTQRPIGSIFNGRQWDEFEVLTST